MRYRPLHGTNLQVSELGFGTWTVSTGWWGNYTDEQAQDLIRRAIDLGFNDLPALAGEPDLAAIRAEPAYSQLLARIMP